MVGLTGCLGDVEVGEANDFKGVIHESSTVSLFRALGPHASVVAIKQSFFGWEYREVCLVSNNLLLK